MKILKDNFKLLPDQVEQVKSLVTKRRALFVDATGNGKTPMSLYAFAYLLSKGSVKRMLVLTPLNAHNFKIWENALRDFTNLRSISLEEISDRVNSGESLDDILSKYHLIFGKHTFFDSKKGSSYQNYQQILRSICKYWGKDTLIVIDEVHNFRRYDSALPKIVREITELGGSPKWGLTATDYSKNPMDFYGTMEAIYPGRLGRNEWVFKESYCVRKDKVIGKDSEGRLKRVKDYSGFKDFNTLKDELSDCLVIGNPPLPVNMHRVPYELTEHEGSLYGQIAKGICAPEDSDDKDGKHWLEGVLGGKSRSVVEPGSLKSLNRHSSRFVYLQSVVDGSLNADGTFGVSASNKCKRLLQLVNFLASRGESCLIYCDYYASVDVILHNLKRANIKGPNGTSLQVLENSSRVRQKEGFLTKSMTDYRPYSVAMTKATSESANYPFIKHIIFYNTPTTPIPYLQFKGRITRKNTIYKDDLHVWMFDSDTIDRYKLHLLGHKLNQMQAVSYDMGGSYFKEYLGEKSELMQLEMAKKLLLWRK